MLHRQTLAAGFPERKVDAMLVSFGLLANGPVLLADHSSHWNWTESSVNLAVAGASWVVADSLARPRRQSTFD